MRKLMALMALLALALPMSSDAAWLICDEDGNLIHFPLREGIQEGDPWVDSNGIFLGVWVWV